MERIHYTEQIQLIFTKRIGIVVTVLSYYGYAHQSVMLMSSINRKTKEMIIKHNLKSILGNLK